MAAVPAMSGEDDADQQFEELRISMIDSGCALRKFSEGLLSLYTTNQVTGTDDDAKKFLQVRDEVRTNAIVYRDRVLPLTERAVTQISNVMAYFSDLEFDDWADNIMEHLDDVNKGMVILAYIQLLHDSINTSLIESREKAKLAKIGMDRMHKKYAAVVQELEERAKKHRKTAADARLWGSVFNFGGIGVAVGEYIAHGPSCEADKIEAESTGKRENAELALRAVIITDKVLIASVQDFLDGIEACSKFLTFLKMKLGAVKNYGEKGRKMVWFKAMKKKSLEIQKIAAYFVSMTNFMKNEINAIPEQVGDKNYVDWWLEKRKQEFEKNHKSTWELICTDLREIWQTLLD